MSETATVQETRAQETAAERVFWIAAAVVVFVAFGAWWLKALWGVIHTRLEFDDAYMFYRYAVHVREGLGISWNPDGVHTYGQTAPLWGAVVVLLTYLPVDASEMLRLGSVLSSIGALGTMAWSVSTNAKSRWLRHEALVLPLLAWPLMHSGMFYGNATNGMETMLAVMLCGLYVGVALGWQRGAVRPEVVAMVGLLLFLTRPESALAVVVLPVLLHWLLPGTTRRGLAMLLGIFVAAVLLDMLVCRWYFGSALPLSFAMKSKHGYAGYLGFWRPVSSCYQFVAQYRWYLAALALCVRRPDWRLVVACLTPALLTFGYLCTVTQIMGYDSRYYMPYLAFFLVPALLVVDRRLAQWGVAWRGWDVRGVLVHVAAAVVVLVCTTGRIPEGVARVIDRGLRGHPLVYDPVELVTDAGKPLPEVPYLPTMWAFTDTVATPLPKITIAASEVGYLGGHAPQTAIIDIAGLNDTEIALHGFSMAALLARKPDVIWMPHPDYTYQRGLMLADPELLAEYDVYAGAANYGLAVRKDSPYRAQLVKQMQVLWAKLYPGLSMKDYLVRSAHWSDQAHRLKG
jgi:hypothetical protein